MRVLITGNLGYIGPVLVAHLRHLYPNSELIGFDSGYFAHCLTGGDIWPEVGLSRQVLGDMRNFPDDLLSGVDAIVHLAAISNDPMGNSFEKVTLEINYESSIKLAQKAKQAGVKSFVFASSCSVYGYAEDGARNETSPVDPLTAYARSKVNTEKGLSPLADDNFKVTCLRFATACGMSPRLRLDLVLNDFVASAIATKKITILSDGTPWRPLIHVKDMARAIDWAIGRPLSSGGNFLVINAGSDQWNYQVKDLAMAVAEAMPGTEISINKAAPPDKRSYKVDFAKFRTFAPNHQPQITLNQAIDTLKSGLEKMAFNDPNFRQSKLMRLNTLSSLRKMDVLSEDLRWNYAQALPKSTVN